VVAAHGPGQLCDSVSDGARRPAGHQSAGDGVRRALLARRRGRLHHRVSAADTIDSRAHRSQNEIPRATTTTRKNRPHEETAATHLKAPF
jgi:hypothetical protein